MPAANELVIYTDGAARGNPGPGGYGAVLKWGKAEKELSGGFRHTTNNRMEIFAVIAALESLTKDDLNIVIYSDSQYVVKAWQLGWLKNGSRPILKVVKRTRISGYVTMNSRGNTISNLSG